MSVLDRSALEASPLADLHAIASELSIDSYRRLRRPELIEAILARQTGEELVAPAPQEPATDDNGTDTSGDEDQPATRRRRGRRGGRGRTGRGEPEAESAADDQATVAEEPEPRAAASGREPSAADPRAAASGREPSAAEEIVEGVVELLPNGSGFVRVTPPEPSDQDVYISAAQVKRCELISGDRISGQRRPPRRSERFASLTRIDAVNGRPADEVADSTRFDDLPAAFPTEQLRLPSDDPTVKAIESLTPFGRGSRVTIFGGFGAGKTEALRRLAATLAGDEGLQLSLALAGVRPEEIGEWSSGPVVPAAAVSLAASSDAQAHAVELVIDQGRRLAARGVHAVVLIDSLDGLHGHAARRAIGAARNIVDGGSLTVIATASRPIGGETTLIAMDRALTRAGRFPAIDPETSGAIRSELFVGAPGVRKR